MAAAPKKGSSQVSGMVARSGVIKAKQLGGTGRDQDGGKERGEFEDDRRGRNEGGADRPPIYKPEDDGERGGYIGRSQKSTPLGPAGRAIKGSSAVHGMLPQY